MSNTALLLRSAALAVLGTAGLSCAQTAHARAGAPDEASWQDPGENGEDEEAEEQEEGEAGDEEEAIALSALPQPVAAAAARYFGALDGCKASKETDEGRVCYEVAGKTASGMLSVLLEPGGGVLEVEREVRMDALPAAVRAELHKRWPAAQTVMLEEVEKHYYEVHLLQGGKPLEAVLTAAGQVRGHEGGKGEDEEEGEEADEQEEGGR